RTLARSADPRHADQCAQWKRNAQLLEIVGRGALDGNRLALARAAALGGRGDRHPPRQILAGDRAGRVSDLSRQALRHDLPAVPPGARADVDQVIGLAHDRLVVFDDQHAIALVLEVAQRLDQAPVVARMQADRGFVEDIADADEPRADAGRQADTL